MYKIAAKLSYSYLKLLLRISKDKSHMFCVFIKFQEGEFTKKLFHIN